MEDGVKEYYLHYNDSFHHLIPIRKVDDVAASLSQLQAQIVGISIEDIPTDFSRKDGI